MNFERFLAAIEPIRLATQEAGDAPTDGAAWTSWAAGLALVAALSFAAHWLWRVRRLSAEERAFRALARRLWVPRGVRRTIRGMARAAGLPPVALLLSEHAFRSAAAAFAGDRSGVERAATRLFRK